MNRISTLIKYFPTGTAEGDRQILDRAFITPEQLAAIISSPPGNPRILVGRKGVGKSAILERLHSIDLKHGIPALLLRPDDLDTSDFSSASDIGTLKRGMYACLTRSLVDCIGSQLHGFLTGSKALIYEEAVRSGAREPDWAGKLLGLLSEISKPITEIDGSSLAQSLTSGRSNTAITNAVNDYLLNQNQMFMVLIDDTDQIASPDQPDHLNRIWALILATRKLAQTFPFLRCIITLRTEVWMRLTKNAKGQRDQVDHVRPLILMLRAHEKYMLEILFKRFQLAAAELGESSSEMTTFFESKEVRLPTSDEKRAWTTFILKCSRERPRDMIQLVLLLAENARKRGSEKIGDADAEKAMKEYSKDRAEDLAIEMGHACPAFLDIVRAFSAMEFEVDFETLRGFLKRIPSRFGVTINGNVLNPEKDSSVLLLLSLLHEADFINPRVDDATQPRGFRHISFLDDPHLVEKSRWNELQKMVWEIHPAFRTYLLALKGDFRK
jgi:hypothetical protein